MKKIILYTFALLLTISNFAFAKEKLQVLKVAVNPVPNGDVFKLIKDDLAKDGIDLVTVEFTDYVTPNLALHDKQVDANAFQTVQYLNSFNAAHKTDIVPAYDGKTILAPLALYSRKIKNIKEIKDGAKIGIPNDPTNGGRALALFEKAGFIKLKKGANGLSTPKDIIDNPKKLEFRELDAAQLPRSLDDFTASVVNGGYAVEAGLDVKKDSLLIEDAATSPFVNIIAVRKGDEKDPRVQKLIKAYHTQKVRDFINGKYKGTIVAGF